MDPLLKIENLINAAFKKKKGENIFDNCNARFQQKEIY